MSIIYWIWLVEVLVWDEVSAHDCRRLKFTVTLWSAVFMNILDLMRCQSCLALMIELDMIQKMSTLHDRAFRLILIVFEEMDERLGILMVI